MSEQDNPWKTLSSKTHYENPWIKVDEHQVLNPNGNPGIYGVVSFKNRAVAILPLDDEGNTWIVGQYRYPLKEYHWELPMGGAPESEDLLTCAQRELKEETGLLAQDWQLVLELHLSNSITQEYGVAFIAKGLQQFEPEFEDTEKIEIKKIPAQELLERVLSGEITDSLTVATVMKAKLLGYF